MSNTSLDRAPKNLSIHDPEAILSGLAFWLRFPKLQSYTSEDFIHALNCLNLVNAPKSEMIVHKILDVIEEKCSPNGNYSQVTEKQLLKNLIPNDLKESLSQTFSEENPIKLVKDIETAREAREIQIIDQFYFQAPASHLESVNLKVSLVCDVCDRMSFPCLELYKGWKGRIIIFSETEKFTSSHPISPLRDHYQACLDCLETGGFHWVHNTGSGGLSPKTFEDMRSSYKDFSEQSLLDFMHTPGINTEQDAFWLTHCKDFMNYIGEWQPSDFEKAAKRKAMNVSELFDTMLDGDSHLDEDKDWKRYLAAQPSFYVFKCRHCREHKGYFQFD